MTNPYYIPVSRSAKKDDKRWEIVRRCNGSRKAMVNFICGIGGYSAGRGDHYAVEFNVSANRANLDVDNLWKLLTSDRMDCGPEDTLPPEHMAVAKALFYRVYNEHTDHVWDWAIEEAYEGWRDSDTPYETFTGHRVEWTFGLYGRGGKHLCMESCGDIDLTYTSDDLEERLHNRADTDERGYFGEFSIGADAVTDLFIICVQNSVELTSVEVGKEVEYRAAWRLWVSFCEDELAGAIKEYENRQSLGEDALGIFAMLEDMRADGSTWADSFKQICKLADIAIEE